jgi:hypothetical protein
LRWVPVDDGSAFRVSYFCPTDVTSVDEEEDDDGEDEERSCVVFSSNYLQGFY